MNVHHYFPKTAAAPLDPATFFIATWDTRNISTGSTPSNQVSLPLVQTGGVYDFFVDWGDGSSQQRITTWDQAEKLHTYTVEGVYTITLKPRKIDKLRGWAFAGGLDRLKILDIQQWGGIEFLSVTTISFGCFNGCGNLNVTATDSPVLLGSLVSFFRTCTSLVGNSSFNNWDVSNSTNFSAMFQQCTNFNQPLNLWNVSNGQIFGGGASGMFYLATSFNQNIGGWNMSSATNVAAMFRSATSFNNGGSNTISTWNVSNVITFGASVNDGMFTGATAFNQPIGSWNVSSGQNFSGMLSAVNFNQNIGSWIMSSATNLTGMFLNATAFNNGGSPDINNWNVVNVTNVTSLFQSCVNFNQPLNLWTLTSLASYYRMFFLATSFNQNLGAWNMINATNMSEMFRSATAFNNGGSNTISTWNVSGVSIFGGLNAGAFLGCTNFNQPIGSWNMSSATNIQSMLQGATSFNQDLGGWNVENVTNATLFLSGVTLSIANYDSLLIGWGAQNLQQSVPFHGGSSQFCLGDDARQSMIDVDLWTITDGGLSPTCQFIADWDTNNISAGSTANNQIRLPLQSTGSYNFTVDWGDTTSDVITTWDQAEATHTYSTSGIYEISLSGKIIGFKFNNGGDRLKILDIKKWSNVRFNAAAINNRTFLGCGNLNVSAVDQPNFTHPTAGIGFFMSCTSLNSNSINNWDVSMLTTLQQFFWGCSSFNNPLNDWDVSNVTSFDSTFFGCTLFNQPLNLWNVSSGSLFIGMFASSGFNQNIGGWIMSNATNLQTMFKLCPFNNGGSDSIKDWDVSNVTTFGVTSNAGGMFTQNTAFSQPIVNWDVSSGQNFAFMFRSTTYNQPLNWNMVSATILQDMFSICVFNQDISGWNVSNVTSFSSMFASNLVFNQPIGSWNVGSGQNFGTMFSGCDAFDQNLGLWNTINATNMLGMFNACDVFNNGGSDSIKDWNVSNVTTFGTIANSVGMFSRGIFNQPIGSWNVSSGQNFDSMFFSSPFNQPLNWNMVSATNLRQMLATTPFNQDISGWNVSNVLNFRQMFQNNTVFNQNISTWNVGNATNMESTFAGATAFNQNLGIWNVSKVTDMRGMFRSSGFNNGGSPDINNWVTSALVLIGGNNWGMFAGCPFNQNIGAWDMSKVTTFSQVFYLNTAFNNGGSPDINNWVTTSALLMDSMFFDATAFNQPIGSWNVGSVTNFLRMFQGATAFDQDIGGWQPTLVTDFTSFMLGKLAANYSAANLDSIYNQWSSLAMALNIVTTFGTIQYTSAAAEGKALLNRADATVAVSDIVDNGSGLIRVTTSTDHLLTTDNKIFISDVLGTTEANGAWIVTVIDATTIDLQASTFTNAYTSGGTVRTGYGWTITDGGQI